MKVEELWRQYRKELLLIAREERAKEPSDAEQFETQQGAMMATPSPSGEVPGADRMHEVLHGLDALFGTAVRAVVSEPWHETRDAVIGQLGSIRSLQERHREAREEADRTDIIRYEMRDIYDDFVRWVDARYYLRERKAK